MRRDNRPVDDHRPAEELQVPMRTDDGLAIMGPCDGDVFGGRTHLHRGEAEAFFILEGELELLGATSTTRIGPGTFVLVPPDTAHGLRILGSREARWLAVWPSALDGLPEELAQAAGDPSAIAAVRERHGMAAGRRR